VFERVKGSKLFGVPDPASDEFEAVRRDPDPLRRGRRATELLTLYQQRSTELARLRKAAIEEARRDQDLTYTEIAAALGITKGRITQIRGSAPSAERGFFGVGPVAVGVPWRYQTTDRERPLIAAEDAKSGDLTDQVLTDLGFTVTRFQLGPETDELPDGDAVVICGPKSAPAASALLAADPRLGFVQANGRWSLQETGSGVRHDSPSDNTTPESVDLGYLGRHRIGSRTVVHIAGIHTMGSLGVVDYLAKHLADIYAQTKDHEFSCVIRAEFDGLDLTGSSLAAGPFLW